VLSTVTFAKIADRLDAEFYHPQFLEVESIIENAGRNPTASIAPMSDLTVSIRKGIFSILKTEYRDAGVPFIRVSEIRDLVIEESGLTYISEEKNIAEGKTCLKPQNLVITKTGAYAGEKVAIIPKHLGRVNISQDVVGVVVKEDVSSEYLAAFLSCRFGRTQLQRMRSRLAQPHIELNPIRNLRVVLLPEAQRPIISDKLQSAIGKVYKGKQEYSIAKERLSEALQMTEKPKPSNTFLTRFSEVEAGRRLDVEYFRPAFTDILQILESGQKSGLFKVKKLGEISRLLQGVNVGSNSYVDSGGRLFLRISNIAEKGLQLSQSDKFVRENVFFDLRDKFEPHEGEVLYSKDGTIGTAMVTEAELPDCLASGGIVRIRSPSVDPYYLTAVLNSQLCKAQAERHSIGTVIKHLPFGEVRSIMVPIVSKQLEHEIGSLLKQSIEKEREGYQEIRKVLSELDSSILALAGRSGA